MAAAPMATIGYTVETTRFSRDWDIGAWGKAQRRNEYHDFKRAEISRGSITLHVSIVTVNSSKKTQTAPYRYHSPLKSSGKIRYDHIYLERIQSRMLKDPSVKMNESFFSATRRVTAAIYICITGPHEIRTDFPLLWIVRNFAKEEEHAKAGTKLVFIERETSCPIV
jgi:hypothetical protein